VGTHIELGTQVHEDGHGKNREVKLAQKLALLLRVDVVLLMIIGGLLLNTEVGAAALDVLDDWLLLDAQCY
jgi:hypothetical protein